MNRKAGLIVFLAGFILTTIAYAQTPSTNYLNTADPISFEHKTFHLAWTSHPTDNYYKQEYLSKGDTLEKYKKLILLETITGTMKPADAVAIKIAELKKLKETNPVINYETLENGGEIILDFLMSQNTPDDKYLSIVERNVYRYKSFTDKNGHTGVLLFGVSERAYGDDIDSFFPTLKAHRNDLINAVGAFVIPEVTISK